MCDITPEGFISYLERAVYCVTHVLGIREHLSPETIEFFHLFESAIPSFVVKQGLLSNDTNCLTILLKTVDTYVDIIQAILNTLKIKHTITKAAPFTIVTLTTNPVDSIRNVLFPFYFEELCGNVSLSKDSKLIMKMVNKAKNQDYLLEMLTDSEKFDFRKWNIEYMGNLSCVEFTCQIEDSESDYSEDEDCESMSEQEEDSFELINEEETKT